MCVAETRVKEEKEVCGVSMLGCVPSLLSSDYLGVCVCVSNRGAR